MIIKRGIFKQFYYYILFYLSKEIIINNPLKLDKESNPVNYIIIYQSDTAEIQKETETVLLNIIKDFNKFIHHSYIFSQSLFIFSDESNNYYLFIEYNFFQLILSNENEIQSLSNKKTFPNNIQFMGYIKLFEHSGEMPQIGGKCKIPQNEIVLYGKTIQNIIYFYFISEDNQKNPNVFTASFGMIEGTINCKLIKENVFICVCYEAPKFKLKILAHVYTGINAKGLVNEDSIDVPGFSNHDNPILYDTSNSYYKILCAREKTNNNIECISLYIEAEYSISSSYSSISFYNILNNNYQAIYSYKEDSCNYTVIDSEYLICCGGTDKIMCDRKDTDFNLINSFTLNHTGKITNITFEIDDNNIKILYSIILEEESNIYEYNIYIPECINQRSIITSFQTARLNLNELFTRRTNSKYYISLDNFPERGVSVKLNDNAYIQNDRQLLDINDNYLYIISEDGLKIKNHIINFNISIEETYSKTCQISFTVDTCYSYCKKCSQSSNDKNNQYCTECKEDLFTFLEGGTNCYNKTEVEKEHPNWFFNDNKKIFEECDSLCKTCFISADNCTSCPPDDDNNLLYLYNGSCISECPNGTFITNDTEGNYICENCYKNCKTCIKRGNATHMNCDSCFENQIINEKGCYNIHSNSIKSFINPENNSEITSCYELFNKYIIDNTNICISEFNEGYFISNNITGLLSKCNSNCKTCSKISTHCDSCNEGLYLQENTCVINCASNYYSEGNNCFKCHDNCLTCFSGKQFDQTGYLISMGCSRCLNKTKNNIPMIQIEDNCFPIIIYEETKILFNISEINRDNIIGSCLNFGLAIFYGSFKCISKPKHTFFVLANDENSGVIDKYSL